MPSSSAFTRPNMRHLLPVTLTCIGLETGKNYSPASVPRPPLQLCSPNSRLMPRIMPSARGDVLLLSYLQMISEPHSETTNQTYFPQNYWPLSLSVPSSLAKISYICTRRSDCDGYAHIGLTTSTSRHLAK